MTKPLNLHVCTWNLAGVDLPDDKHLDYLPLLGLESDQWPDLIALGFQEVHNGPSRALLDLVSEDRVTTLFRTILAPKRYILVKSVKVGALLLLLFIRQCYLPLTVNVCTASTTKSPGEFFSPYTKGGVTVSLDLAGVSFCIVNSHLTPHGHNKHNRITDCMDILENQIFKDSTSILDHDYIFWFGDLNFRLDDVSRSDVIEKIGENDLKNLWNHDQLLDAQGKGLVFEGFEEGLLDFAPSYKFDINTDTYDTSHKQRKPAWTDRILYRVDDDEYDDVFLMADQLSYTSLPQYTASDHKPVSSQFVIQVIESHFQPPVTFGSILDWHNDEDGEFAYTVQSPMETSSWDWIGIYKTNFRNISDYVTYMWAPAGLSEHTRQGVTLVFKDVNYDPGSYLLCYVDSEQNFRGLSDDFEILPSYGDSSISSSDSEDEGDTEL